MEAPSAAHLARIAPGKKFDAQILAPMVRQVAKAIERGRFARAGQTTQLVVGAAGEKDCDLVGAADWGYRELKLARVTIPHSGPHSLHASGRAERPFPSCASTVFIRPTFSCAATVSASTKSRSNQTVPCGSRPIPRPYGPKGIPSASRSKSI